uniref:Myb-like domain-containing protein n=1 Tax=Araucaria cunninghamii TaxID=56994 RepID=A0A0D6QYM7_ARACU
MTEFLPLMAVQANGLALKSSPDPTSDGPIPINATPAKQEDEPLNNPSIDGGEGQDKAPRLPRWTRQEILVLIEGKRVVESRGKKSRVIVDGHVVNTESKWASISSYCKCHGVNREPVQCRKRWSNLSGDYKKIREWEAKIEGRQDVLSFWAMRNDIRRENKLPGFFDREVYDVLEKYIGSGRQEEEEGVNRREIVEHIFDSSRAEDGVLFNSDFEHEQSLEEIEGSPEKEPEVVLESPTTVTTSTAVTPPPPPPRQGARTDKVPIPVAEKGSASCASGQKRKRSSSDVESDSDLRDQLLSILERNSRILTAHMESQNMNYQLDRKQRKDHADSLIGVLGKLADALGQIADKL